LGERVGLRSIIASGPLSYSYSPNLVDGGFSGSFDSNITFVHNLTEAAKRSERSMIVVSVPVSERVDEAGRSDIELGGEVGKLVAERLEQVLGRLESV
jgi:hypothetical protein